MRTDNRAMVAIVRDAQTSDAAEVGAVAAAAWRDTYQGLLGKSVIEDFLKAAYSVEMLEGRIAHQTFLVAEEEGRVIAFANAVANDDHLNVVAIYALPEARGQGAGTMLLAALRGRFPGLAVRADVLSGNRKGEVFYERRGFAPREVLEDELFGQQIVERRWWLGMPPPIGVDDPGAPDVLIAADGDQTSGENLARSRATGWSTTLARLRAIHHIACPDARFLTARGPAPCLVHDRVTGLND